MSIADWEDLYDEHKENMEQRQREIELFGDVLNEEDLAAELDNLVAEEAAEELAGPVGAGAISATDAAAYREEHGIKAPEPAAAQIEEAPAQPQRQLIGA